MADVTTEPETNWTDQTIWTQEAECEDTFGGSGWATTEEHACRDEVQVAAQKR